MAEPIPIPCEGFEGRGLVLQPAGLWKGAEIWCDGAAAPRQGRIFTLKTNAGVPVTMKLVGSAFDPVPRVETGGQKIQLAPPLPWWAYVLIVLPFALVGVGGMLGGFCGAVAAVTNAQILRTHQPTGLKVVFCLVTIIAVIVVWLVVGLALTAAMGRL